DTHFNSFQTEILPLARERGLGVIGMKSLANGHLFDDPAVTVTAEEARRYALSQPVSSLCVGVDSMQRLNEVLAVGRDFTLMSLAEQAAVVEKAFPHAWSGQHEPFKTSFDYEGNEARREHGLPIKMVAAD